VALFNVRFPLVRHLIFCCLYYWLNITTGIIITTTIVTITITTMILVSWTMFCVISVTATDKKGKQTHSIFFRFFFISWRYNPHWGLYFTAL